MVRKAVSQCRLVLKKPIPTFTARESENGLKFMMAGCLKLLSAPNMPKYVRGLVRMQGRKIPIVDLDAKAGKEPKNLSEESCIILYERKKGPDTISTGAIFTSVQELLDQIKPQNA